MDVYLSTWMSYTYFFSNCCRACVGSESWLASFQFLVFSLSMKTLSSEFSCRFCWEHTKWSISFARQLCGSAAPALCAGVCKEGALAGHLCQGDFSPGYRQSCAGRVGWDFRFLIQNLLAVTIEFPFSLIEFSSNIDDTTHHLGHGVSLVRMMLHLPPSSFQNGTGEQSGV